MSLLLKDTRPECQELCAHANAMLDKLHRQHIVLHRDPTVSGRMHRLYIGIRLYDYLRCCEGLTAFYVPIPEHAEDRDNHILFGRHVHVYTIINSPTHAELEA